jgi:hypothetical protein
LVVCRRVIPVLESLHRADPNNEAYRAAVVSIYRVAESAYIDSGMVGEALQTSQKILEEENANPRRDATFWLSQGLTQAKIGSLQARNGDPVAAESSWRAALSLFESARASAAKTYSEHADDRTALALLALAEGRLALMEELLGDRGEARRRIKDAIAHQSALADSDSSKQSWARQLREFRAGGVRLESLNGSPQDLARGWEQYASQLAEIAYPLPARIEAARKAVELARQGGDSLEIADAFAQLGSAQLEAARVMQGSETLQGAEQSYAEARRILTAREQSGTLPEASRSTLGDAVNSLAIIAARLAETVASNK